MLGLSFDRPDAWRDSYDAWKTRTPWDDWTPPPPCQTCGSTWEDGGAEWDIEQIGRWPDEIHIVVPFGFCRECGWRCEPCHDIEDLYERCGDQSQ